MNDRSTVRIVVCILGVLATILILGEIKLVDRVIGQTNPTDAAIALIAGISTLAGTVVGSIGSLLVNTRTDPNQQEIAQALAPLGDGPGGIPVVGVDGGPVVTEEVGGQGGHIRNDTLLTVLIVVLVLIGFLLLAPRF